MGGVMGALKPSYDQNQEVAGTGSTVGELQNAGVTEDQLKLGGVRKQPGALTSGLTSSIAKGLAERDAEKAAIARRGQPVYNQVNDNPALPYDMSSAFYGR
jgi:hypothetical protein